MGLKKDIAQKWFTGVTSTLLMAALVLSSGICASAGTAPLAAPATNGKIQVYSKPDVSIIVNGEERIFRDANNMVVFPVIYNGSTYLPVRAISAIMEEDIEWDAFSKTIFMGKTFSNPNKIKHTETTSGGITAGAIHTGNGIMSFIPPNPAMISAYSRPNFLIMYDFELQVFNDEQGNRVYPIVVNGSAFLPIRAVSGIMNQTIDWDGINKIITIGSPDVPVLENTGATEELIAQFEKQIALYDSATVKIQNLQKAASLDDLAIMATEVSKDYAKAAENTLAVNSMNTSEYTDKELAAYASLVEFTEISEHYILVLENIAYMAAAEQDYTMLAETFMNFAMESQSKLDQTRALVELL